MEVELNMEDKVSLIQAGRVRYNMKGEVKFNIKEVQEILPEMREILQEMIEIRMEEGVNCSMELKVK